MCKELQNQTRIIDKLRNFGLNDLISLPKICVIGSQSAGKSSVLVQIIGHDIIPKGNNTVTRCPLELRLYFSPQLKEFHGIFGHKKQEKFFKEEEI